MSTKLDHIGVAVRDTEVALRFYRDTLGIIPSHDEIVEQQGVKVTFLPVGDANIELIQPVREDSTTVKFLETRGEGIHHICVKVSDIRAAMQKVAEMGYQLIDPEPRKGAHGMLVAFVHPKSTNGVLLELAQPAEHT